MATTAYDARLRMLECPGCGAPLVAPKEGAQVRCGYCSATSAISPRAVAPGAGIRSSLAAETARLSRLKAQLEHPVAGHPYDLTRPPVGYENWSSARPADSERLFRDCSAALRERPSTTVEAQRRVCWLALHASSAPGPAEPLRIRALLETALGWIEDEGYRHLVRCRLARAALSDGDLDATEGWLKECDPVPEVLELDSDLRLMRAWVSAKKKQPQEVLDLLGHPGTEVPIAPSLQDEAGRLRVDALELLGQEDAAYRGFEALEAEHGLEVEEGRFLRDGLAPKTLAAVRQERARQAAEGRRAQLEAALDASVHGLQQCAASVSLRPLRGLPWLALALLVPVLPLRCTLDADPLGGVYGLPLCPLVCASCYGPARTVTKWTSRGNGKSSTDGPEYFCQTADNRVGSMSDDELEQSLSKLEDVRLGSLAATSASYLMLILMFFPLAVIRSVRAAIDNKRKQAALELQIDQLSASLGVPSPALPSSDLGRSLAWTALVLGGTTLAALGLTLAF